MADDLHPSVRDDQPRRPDDTVRRQPATKPSAFRKTGGLAAPRLALNRQSDLPRRCRPQQIVLLQDSGIWAVKMTGASVRRLLTSHYHPLPDNERSKWPSCPRAVSDNGGDITESERNSDVVDILKKESSTQDRVIGAGA